MSKRLYIYLGHDTPGRIGWAAIDSGGRLETGSGPLSRLPRSPGDKLVVIVPGTDVLVTEVDIPGRRSRLIRQSLPYLLEESLVDEVEDLHFASGPAGADRRLPVAAVARHKLAHWLTMLGEEGLVAEVMVPATMCIPSTPDQLTLVMTGEEFLARRGNWQMTAGETANFNYYLAADEQNREMPIETRIIDCGNIATEPELKGITVISTETADLMKVLVEGFNSSPYFNLLQGEFALGARWLEVLRRWRLPLAAAAILLVLSGISLTADYMRLRRQATFLSGEISATYLQTFPSGRVVNARAQMEQKLAESRASARLQSTFLTIYDKMAPLAAGANGFDLDTLRFQNNRLEMELSIADLQALEKLKSDLNRASDLRAEIRNAESSGGRVRARLLVEAGK